MSAGQHLKQYFPFSDDAFDINCPPPVFAYNEGTKDLSWLPIKVANPQVASEGTRYRALRERTRAEQPKS